MAKISTESQMKSSALLQRSRTLHLSIDQSFIVNLPFDRNSIANLDQVLIATLVILPKIRW